MSVLAFIIAVLIIVVTAIGVLVLGGLIFLVAFRILDKIVEWTGLVPAEGF